MKAEFYQTYFTIEKNHWLMRVRRQIVHDQIARFSEVFDEGRTIPARLLDFGCGSGYFIRELQMEGVEAYGVDSSVDATTYGRSLGIEHLSALRGGEVLPFPDGHFECVLAMDVLEHLPDEQFALAELKRVLQKGGIMILTVPAYMWLWGVQDVVSHHFRRYTLPRLTGVVRKQGNLALIRRSYFNTFLFPLIALIRLSSRLTPKSRRGSDFDLNNPILNSIFYAVFGLERWLLRLINYPFGVSILTVFRHEP